MIYMVSTNAMREHDGVFNNSCMDTDAAYAQRVAYAPAAYAQSGKAYRHRVHKGKLIYTCMYMLRIVRYARLTNVYVFKASLY